ncbi:FadR/GntR family transcriptional regulator [Celeribacter halophilus]|uniref:FCD domain-containing protein n=1 Tax=Celeribacter halophilus TaxID=576117 RepID=A0AAW7XRB0_9RHOB|nr:FCD domain-containing protein [Celeribacter halophilus]MBU2891255.1 FCD domain-containing protein [Celeribacter halophilus]MDO6456580.1 FCD domain-containing protein [Celeribacter halophilus]MDO6510858.1 FCD domain-containing protein [Celeribacter halophilus]MDO6723043.1 FCD domain-containing protein [Celeribacter halophilus]
MPNASLPPSPTSLPGATVKYVIETLTTRIVTQEYATEERLPSERQLAQELGVARNTVREALDQLETRGMIRRRAGSGSFVTYNPDGAGAALSPVASETGPLQLQVMRGILEPEMVRLAIVNMSPKQIEALSVVLSKMEAVQADATAFVTLEEEFHRLIAEGTGNPLLIACYNLVLDARRQSFRAAMYRRHLTPARIEIYQRGYNGLFNAIAARDIEEASEFMKLALIEDQRLLLQED